MPISSWSTTAADNDAAPPNGAPEGWAPSAVNDTVRQQMADHKTQWLDAEWFNHGDSGLSRASATTFKLTGDVTTKYLVNRRIKCNDASTLYGLITASSYSAPDTTVTVSLDSGSLTASLTAVSLAILSPNNQSIPVINNLTVAGTATISGAAVFKTTATISGTAVFKNIVKMDGNATQSARFEMFEDTDNGTNKVTIAAPASVAADRTVSLPDTDISSFVVQRVSTTTGAYSSGTGTIPDDDTIPQNTEGNEFMTLAITPKNTNNILVIEVVAQLLSSASTGYMVGALFQDSTADALAVSKTGVSAAGDGSAVVMRHIMTAGTTSATTFKLRGGATVAATTGFNGDPIAASRRFGGVSSSSIMITEYSS